MKQRKLASTTYPILFLLVQSSDHLTGATGLAPTVTISKNGGAFTAVQGAVTEVGSGWYAVSGHAGDRDTLGEIAIHATAGGADPVDDRYAIVPWDPFDANQGLTNLDASITSRLSTAGYTAPDNAAIAGVKTKTDQLTFTAANKVDSTAVTVSDKTGYALSGAGIQAIWDAFTSAFTTAGSIGKWLLDKIDTAVSSRADGALYNGTRAAQLDNLDVAVSSRLATAGYTAPDNAGIAAVKSKTDTINWADVGELQDATLGKWVVNKATNVLTLYRRDGLTILKQFQLSDTVSPTLTQRTPL